MSFANVKSKNVGGRHILKRRSIRKEEEKLSKMTEEEKYEYFMIKKLKKIWNKVRL